MTTLKHWMDRHRIRERQVADGIGVERSTINLLKNGKRSPSLAVAFAIQRFTNGDVPASSWIKDQDKAA